MNVKKAVAGFGLMTALMSMVFANGWAQYDIKEMTSQVRQAIAGRQARYSEVQALKAAGALGENNRGYVEALDGSTSAAVAAAENGDRQTIYGTIAEQNNLGPTGMAIIETVFAEVQHEKARPGDFIQLSTGEWQRK